MQAYRPVLLMILDGWGIREMEHGNAVLQAHTPNYDQWSRHHERAILGASGEDVGLVPDQMGNSEVGHLNLGAGRVLYQDITRIDKAIKEGTLAQHPLLLGAAQKVKSGKKLHLIGLLGTGGVHAHDSHLYALLAFARQQGIVPLVHVITDGRDTAPGSAVTFIQDLQAQVDANGGVIASVCGRYYAMDRDKRWERSSRAFDAIAHHQSAMSAATALEAVQQSLAQNTGDEFILPTVIDPANADLKIQDGDVVVCFNFRADRMRQLVRLFIDPETQQTAGITPVPNLDVLTMTEYEADLPVRVLYPVEIVTNPLAEVLSKHGKKQFHIAETEKYPHVTFFFNGRRETPFDGEDRTIVPSPKVATYDLQPEMSAEEVTQTILQRLQTHDDDFLLVNFANPDMVGHTGSLAAATQACAKVDDCAGRVVNAVLAKGGVALVTADHGNAERMIDEVRQEPHTYHTTSQVPFLAISRDYLGLRPQGILADVAPTVLDLLDVPQPAEMTGRSMIKFDL